MLKTLSRYLLKDFDTHFVPGNAHIRCLAHILNLAVQKILSTIDEAEDPTTSDYFDKSVPLHYDPDTDEMVQEMEDEGKGDRSGDLKDIDSDDDEAERIFIQQLTQGDESLSPLKKVRKQRTYQIHALTPCFYVASSTRHEDCIFTPETTPISQDCSKGLQG